jgi:hypothetical protein
LGLVVAGQHAEADRHPGAHGDVGQAGGRGGADVVEVRGPAADHHTQRDDRVEAGAGEPGGGHRQLERARHLHLGDIGDARVGERAARACP